MSRVLLLLLSLECIAFCHTCTFPSDLIGDWYSTSFGTLTFTSSTFSGFTSALSVASLTFTCYVSSGTQYVAKSSFSLFSGIPVDVYLCLNLQQISTIKFLYTLDSNKDTDTKIRFYTSSAAEVALANACAVSDTRSDGEYELLVLKDQIHSALIPCPDQIQTVFDVTMDTINVNNCSNTTMDGLTSTSLIFNYSSCANGQLNAGGSLNCLYSFSPDYTYVTTYNNDTTTDESSTYRFTCLVYSKSDAILYATEYPKSCHTSQSPTAVDSPGVTYIMTDLYYIPEADTTDYTVIIAVFGPIVGMIIIGVIAIIVYIKCCKKPPPDPPTPPKIRKKKRKLSVTDYSMGTMSRSQSLEEVTKLDIKKQSAGEIITGLSNTNKHAVSNGHAHDTLTKEPWQKKWETTLRPSTPSSSRPGSLRRRKDFSSADGLTQISNLSVMELDTAGPMTTSLPDNLDMCTEIPPLTSSGTNTSKMTTVRSGTPRASPRYAERSHASPRMPEGIGQFGPLSWKSSNESVSIPTLDLKLDPIIENPLSRENTRGELSKSVVRPKPSVELPLASARTFRDSASISTGFTVYSTVSAGDVRLNNLSRLSHLSASNASIFDDPTWLSESSKQTAQAFAVGKNLMPSIPTKKEKDQNWFTKSQQKVEMSREDMDYFRNRAKQSTGLRNTKDTLGVGKSSSLSLQIIEEAKSKTGIRKKKSKVQVVRPATPKFED